jgi:hypothetical protein
LLTRVDTAYLARRFPPQAFLEIRHRAQGFALKRRQHDLRFVEARRQALLRVPF